MSGTLASESSPLTQETLIPKELQPDSAQGTHLPLPAGSALATSCWPTLYFTSKAASKELSLTWPGFGAGGGGWARVVAKAVVTSIPVCYLCSQITRSFS